MKRAGCINLFIGLESGSDKILANMHKGFTRQIARDFLLKLKQSGLCFEVSIIVGYPQEEEKDFKETLSFLKENKRIIPKIAQISTFELYKNSLLVENNDQEPIDENTKRKRMRKIMQFVEKEKIRHTKVYIDNLRYH